MDKQDFRMGWNAKGTVMRDLTDKRWIYGKGFVFLVTGSIAILILIMKHPEPETVILIAIAVFSFMRFYYFAFYVISNYVDGRYRFSGIISFFRYFLTRNR